MQPGERQMLTSRQLAAALGVSESSVKRWVDDGTIIAHRTAGGHRRIPVSAAVEFIRKNRIKPVKPEMLALLSLPQIGEIDSAAGDQLADALLRDEIDEARGIITGRYLAGAEVAAIGDGLLRPALEKIGELWHSRGDGILIEHRAVTVCLQVLSELSVWVPGVPEDAPVAISAGGPTEPYQIAPMLSALVLRERGFAARNLGPLTPLQTVAIGAEKYNAVLCAVSTCGPQEGKAAPAWMELIDTLEQRRTRLIVGGRCVDTLPVEVRKRVQTGRTMAELGAYATGLLDAMRMRARAS